MPTNWFGLGAEVQVVHVTGTAGLGRLNCFGTDFLAAAVACGVHSVLAIMLTLGDRTLIASLRQILANFRAGQGGLKASVRYHEFSLLGKGGTGSSKYGNSGDQIFDVHYFLQS